MLTEVPSPQVSVPDISKRHVPAEGLADLANVVVSDRGQMQRGECPRAPAQFTAVRMNSARERRGANTCLTAGKICWFHIEF